MTELRESDKRPAPQDDDLIDQFRPLARVLLIQAKRQLAAEERERLRRRVRAA